MIYSDIDIRQGVWNMDISISGFNFEQLQPSSYDVKLSGLFLLPPKGSIIDPKHPPALDEYQEVVSNTLFLKPKEFALAATEETIELSNRIVAQLEGRSSLGRLGLAVHSTAGYIDPGFRGTVTMELFNFSENTLVLEAGITIAQLVFSETKTRAIRDYSQIGRYMGQRVPEQSRGV